METKREYKVGKGTSIGILVLLTLGYIMFYADRAIVSVALEPIKKYFSLTDAQAGIMLSIVLLAVGVLSIPASMVVERWSRRWALGLMAIIWSGATFLTGLCTSFAPLLACRFGVGLGEAGYLTGGISWLSVVFPKSQRSRVVGIFSIGSMLGTSLGLILGGIIITATGDWRIPFYLFAIPGIIIGIIVFFCPDYATIKTGGESTFSKQYFKEWGSIFKIKTFVLNAIGQIFLFMVMLSFLSWIPAAMMRAYSMTPATAGTIFGLIGLVVIISGPLGGFLGDKLQSKNKNGRPFFVAVCAIVYVVMCLLTAYSLNWPSVWFIVFAAIETFLATLMLPVALNITNDVTPVRLRATSMGIITFITFLCGSMVGPYLVGAISDATGGGAAGLKTGLFSVSFAVIITVIIYFIMTRFYHSDSENVSDAVYSEK